MGPWLGMLAVLLFFINSYPRPQPSLNDSEEMKRISLHFTITSRAQTTILRKSPGEGKSLPVLAAALYVACCMLHT